MRLPIILSALALPLAAQSPCSILQADFNTPTYAGNISMGGPNLLLAIRLTAPITYVATRIEMFTGNGVGSNTVAIWSHDAVNNQPLAVLGQGSWLMSRIRGWQGANLTQPVPVLQAQVIWLVWAPINGAQASVEGTGAGAQPQRGSFNGGQTWNGPFQSNQWKFRILGGSCGHGEVFGTGCMGASRTLPELGWGGIPAVGGTFSVLLERGVPSDFALLVIGDSNTSWNTTPLPYDLTPHGAAGCLLHASPVATLFSPTDALGGATFSTSVPPNLALYGLQFYGQWLVHDAAANAVGIKVSNAGAGVVGQ
jgi:hypothetical protein